jgi:hypothetical protein
MLFYQITNSAGDPGLATEMDSLWKLPYNLTSRSRITGLGSNGFAFINTDNPQTNIGAGFVGAAVLGLNTLGVSNIQVSWAAGTVTPNTMVYGIRLQYSVGTNGIFTDVLDAQNNPVEYLRNSVAGHSTNIGPITLPVAAINQPYVLLRWKYYWISGTSGSRAQLRVGNIRVAVVPTAPQLGNVSLDGTGTIHFNFNSVIGQSYQLEFKDDLNDPDWHPLGPPVNGTGGAIDLSDDMSLHPQRFYRLALP